MTSSLRPTPSAPHAQAADARNPQAGFTLIEIMFAMVIFGIGVMALMACVPMASKRIMSSGAQTRASSLAAETAEHLLTVPYGNSVITAGTHDDAANPHDGLYYTRWVVEDDTPISSCKRITVTVARGAASNAPQARVVIVSPRSGG